MSLKESLEHPPGNPGTRIYPRWQTVVLIVLLTCVMLAGTGLAWTSAFSCFREYDDEGFLMRTTQLMLEGHTLYDELGIAYGPFYYACCWVAFHLLHLPLMNATVRILTILVWVAVPAILAATLYRTAARRKIGYCWQHCGACSAFTHLSILKGEPGHPQLLVVLGVSAALFVGTFVSPEKLTFLAAILGMISAAWS